MGYECNFIFDKLSCSTLSQCSDLSVDVIGEYRRVRAMAPVGSF